MPNDSHNRDRIEEKFRELRDRGEGALITYLTGGDPEPKSFLANATALIEGGADIIEIGIPFSDPIADGPVIQASSARAISTGATPSGILDLIRKLSQQSSIPIVVLSYYNPILSMGLERFLEQAQKSGVDGIVVPDLPVEESHEFRDLSMKYGVDIIYLAAPNTSKRRLEAVLEKSRGFVYLVSLYGVTGPRDSLSPQALEAVRTTKSLSKGRIPISAGFGISEPRHVTEVIKAGADGAIVGSTLVRVVGDHLDDPNATVAILRQTAKSLKGATRLGRARVDENLPLP